VDCSGKELQEIPELNNSHITTLDLSSNKISVAVPPNSNVWGSRLNFLYLSNNNIKDVNSDFRKLPELMHVHLDYNLITVIDPHAFEGNTKLWKLILNGNELAITKGTQSLIVPSLGIIELDHCSISDLPIGFFKNMSNLVSIRLSNNKIEKLHNETFSHLKKLRYLHLEGNQIKQIDLDIFKTNHGLQWLYLRGNPLDNFNRKHFLASSSLISLDVSSCNITTIPTNFFSNLHNLLSLNLSDNRLQSFNMRAVPQNLEVLDISGNRLTSVVMATTTIRRLDSLKQLDLTNNSFTCECRGKALWKWCENLRSENGGASSCEEYCPSPCGETVKPDGGKTAIGSGRTRMNTVSEETSMETETSDNQEKKDVETYEGPGVISREDANDTLGELRVNDVGESGESGGSGKTWSIIVYSCIGVFGGLCLIGAIALVTDTILGCRKSRNREASRAPSRNSLRNVRLELMDPIDDRQETTPLSLHRGFDFVSQPSKVHKSAQPGQLHRSSINK
jgi:Leucine-rich repeat (LRR) protein